MRTNPLESERPALQGNLTIQAAVRQGWQWLTFVRSDDPIRHALNRGFAYIIIVFMVFSLLLFFALTASGERAAATVSIISIPIQIFMWWLNRRGTVYGAVLYVLWIILAIVLGSPPASYAGADTPIPLLLILPLIMATLFVRPQAGLWALILMMIVLAVQLVSSDVPRAYVQRFLVIATLDLTALTLLLMIGASIFWRTLRTSTTVNEALRRQQEQFRYAALATQDAIYDWDLLTNIVTRNEAYQRLYASDDPQDAVQSWWESHLHPDDNQRVQMGMQNIFRARRDFWSEEYRFRRPDGDYATVVDRAYIMYDPAGKPVRMIGAMTDITERKRAEVEHLELALARERAELLKEFVNTLSHDLKTPLTIINSSLYLLEKSTDAEQQKSRVEQIKEQVERLGRLIQDLLTISRLDTVPDLVFQPLDVNQLIFPLQAQFQDVVEKQHLTFNFDLAPGLSAVSGSQSDLQRAFVNLVENALYYTPANGTVTVRTFESAGQIIVEVRDTGIGIGAADLPHIFETFYRSDEARAVDTRGTGLGLAIVKKIINRHHGKIEVESHIGQGTTFRVKLPIAR